MKVEEVNLSVTLKQVEAVDLLNRLGIPCSDRTLLNYEKWGLISSPQRGSGKKGKWTEYNIVSISEAIVAWRLIHGKYDAQGMHGFFDGNVPKINPKIIALTKEIGDIYINVQAIPNFDEDIEFIAKAKNTYNDVAKRLHEHFPVCVQDFICWLMFLWRYEKIRAFMQITATLLPESKRKIFEEISKNTLKALEKYIRHKNS